MAEPGPTRRYEVSPYVEFRMFQLSDAISVGAPLAELDRSGSGLFVGGAGAVRRSARPGHPPTSTRADAPHKSKHIGVYATRLSR